MGGLESQMFRKSPLFQRLYVVTKESIIEWTYCSENLPSPLFAKEG